LYVTAVVWWCFAMLLACFSHLHFYLLA
jgi:hypothetical protein